MRASWGDAFKMNGEIPTIPIISLAGIASLSDRNYFHSIANHTLQPYFDFTITELRYNKNCCRYLTVLPEMPLPVPLASTLSSRSLLFHPRVAEEAQRLLSTHDAALASQLQHALTSTTYNPQHILLRFVFIYAN